MIRRVMIIVMSVVAIAAMNQFVEPEGIGQPSPNPVVGGETSGRGSGSTWFCPFGTSTAGEAAVPTNSILITTEDRAVVAEVTMYRTAALEDGSTTVSETVNAAANTVTEVRLDDRVDGGATVEISGGSATVAQKLVAPNRSDQADCVTEAAQQAYFAAAQTTTGSFAQLWLVNPFPTSLSVDVRVTIEGGVRIPGPVSGVIVPARSSRLLDLGTIPEVAELREQFSIAVEGRSGRFVAGLAQTVAGNGLRATIGVQHPATNWVIPYSFTGSDFSEKLWIFNPSSEDTAVIASVFPQGVATEMMPEPFTFDLPGRQYTLIDLTAEGRLPTTELRWIHVESLSDVGIVVNSVVSITAASGTGEPNTRPALAGGLAAQVGATVQATSWIVSSVDPASESQSVVAVANPSPESIAVLTITRIARSGDGAPAEVIVENQEIAPLGTVAYDISQLADVNIGLRVDATSPVVVAGRTTSSAATDLAVWTALPIRESVMPLPVTGG